MEPQCCNVAVSFQVSKHVGILEGLVRLPTHRRPCLLLIAPFPQASVKEAYVSAVDPQAGIKRASQLLGAEAVLAKRRRVGEATLSCKDLVGQLKGTV